jgi:hypothetical protein
MSYVGIFNGLSASLMDFLKSDDQFFLLDPKNSYIVRGPEKPENRLVHFMG